MASDRILNAVMTVDLPALFGPTRTLNDERATEYCLNALKFRQLTDVNLSNSPDLSLADALPATRLQAYHHDRDGIRRLTAMSPRSRF